MNTREVVFVGLSGGVDSSVAALRLLKAGYEVVGVFIRVWHPEFIACTEETERLDAMRVAAHLRIPFLTCDAVQEYKADVAEYMIANLQDAKGYFYFRKYAYKTEKISFMRWSNAWMFAGLTELLKVQKQNG